MTQLSSEGTQAASPLLLYHICGHPIVLIEREEMVAGTMAIPPRGRGHRWKYEPHTSLKMCQHYFDGASTDLCPGGGNAAEIDSCPDCHFRLIKELLFPQPFEQVLAEWNKRLIDSIRLIGDNKTQNAREEEENEQMDLYTEALTPLAWLLRILGPQVYCAVSERTRLFRQSQARQSGAE